MEQKNNINTRAAFDLRLEAMAVALLDESEDLVLEQLVVSPVGPDRRRSEYEVRGARRKNYEHDTVLLVEVNRKGLFDTLPDGLFVGIDEEEHDTARKKTRAIRKQTADARKFFLPFEQAMYHPRIEAERLEQRLSREFPDFMIQLWGLDRFADLLDDRQRLLLCHLLPEAHRMVGNWELTGLCFEEILRKPVDLNFIAPLRHEAATGGNELETLRLGTDSVLGGSFNDDIPALEVSIRGITYHEVEAYLPGGAGRILLEELLYAYLLPLDLAVVTKIIVTDDAWTGEFGRGVLGYNLILN